jgi:hypothetical protein
LVFVLLSTNLFSQDYIRGDLLTVAVRPFTEVPGRLGETLCYSQSNGMVICERLCGGKDVYIVEAWGSQQTGASMSTMAFCSDSAQIGFPVLKDGWELREAGKSGFRYARKCTKELKGKKAREAYDGTESLKYVFVGFMGNEKAAQEALSIVCQRRGWDVAKP